MAVVDTKDRKYTQTLGRRKAATAQVRLYPGGEGKIEINGKTLEDYVGRKDHQISVKAPFEVTGTMGNYDVTVRVRGGGITGQAEAIRLGISRALETINPDLRDALKTAGFLTRDARVRERKKYGRKSARRSPQWSKR